MRYVPQRETRLPKDPARCGTPLAVICIAAFIALGVVAVILL